MVRNLKKNEKEKKETKKQRIFSKEIYLLFLLVIVLIGGLGISHLLSQSYAALQPVESLPETLTSKLEMNAAAGITIPARSNYIPNISILKRFYAVDPAGTEYDIYCLDRWLVQNGGIHYVKSDTPIEDKGMAYLLSQIYPNNDDFLKGKTDDVKRYISQLTVWFYQDRKDGYSDTVDICSVPEYTNNGCKGTGDDAESDTTFYWKNSLLASEKEAIKNSEYWPTMEKIITAAANYQEDDNYSITINRDEVSFEVTSDGKYMESNYISVMTTGSNFLGYTLTTNSQNVTFYDEQGKKINSGTTTSQNTKFKIRVPIETVKEAGKLSVNVDVSGSFSSKDAYFYHPEDSSFQRALMGAMQLNPIRRGVNLAIEYPMGSVKISKVDATTGEELAGATLVVKDANGTEIDRWVSTDEPHYIDPIKEGKYTLTETIAPEGYQMQTSSIEFSVTKGLTTEVEMQNVPEIDVPDTSIDIPISIYIVGAIVFIIGVGLIVISVKKPRHE